MSGSAPPSPLRELLDTHSMQISSEVDRLLAETKRCERHALAERLNEAARRIRQSPDLDELTAIVADTAGAFSSGVAVFRIENEVARTDAMRGVPEETAERFRGVEFPLASAAALAGAVHSRDPVVAAATAAEVSEELAGIAGREDDGRVLIFPLVDKESVPALVCAWGAVEWPAVELLTQVAASVWSELARLSAAALVQIAPAAAEPPDKAASSWDDLSAAEQRLHLRAQRFARVKVAEMRLREGDLVQAGRARRELYGELRKSIDAAREVFHRDFFAPCPSMVDYLHVELVRTLANDDPDALGKDYPGPLV